MRFVVDGTSATSNNGTVKVRYSNKAGKLKISSKDGTLHLWDVNGCLSKVAMATTVSLTARTPSLRHKPSPVT